jgi:oxaloacetate decarboxylase (Na+ extruding) subunit gamma
VFFESIKIMLLGMGTVFLFLIIMVYVTKLMSKLILRYFPEVPKVQAVASAPKTSEEKRGENAKIAAVLGALQHHHQLEKGGKIG